MTWRTAAVVVALLVSSLTGATLAGGVFVVPSHGEVIGTAAPDGSSAGPSDTELLPAAMTTLQAFVSVVTRGFDRPTEVSVATLPPVGVRDAPSTGRSVIQSVLHTPMTYPVEAEPDGNRWLPHHGLWALGLYLIGWYYWYPGGAPFFGATLVGLAVLLLLDDWLSHGLGVKTPGDMAFEWLMRRRSFRRMYIRLWWIIYR